MGEPQQRMVKCRVCGKPAPVVGNRVGVHFSDPGVDCTGAFRPVPPIDADAPDAPMPEPGYGYEEIGPINKDAQPYRQRDEPGHPAYVPEPPPMSAAEKARAADQAARTTAAQAARATQDSIGGAQPFPVARPDQLPDGQIDSFGAFVERAARPTMQATPQPGGARAVAPVVPIHPIERLIEAFYAWMPTATRGRQELVEMVASQVYGQLGDMVDRDSRYQMASGIVTELFRLGVVLAQE